MVAMTAEEQLRQELEAAIAARQELESALQKAAEYGQDLLAQVQEHERTIQEYREKERAVEPDSFKSQAQRRQSTARRASTISFPRTHVSSGDAEDSVTRTGSMPRRVGFLPGSPDSDDEEPKARPAKAVPRRGRGGQTMVVEDLMQQNQSLEEDLRRLQVNYQKLQEQDDSEEDEEGEGSERKPKRKSRKCSSIRDVDEVVPDEEISDPDLQQQADEIEELRQALRTAQKEAAKQLQTLEAEVESKKQEVEERRAAEQVAKSNAAQSESKCKVLQERLQVMAEENDKTERELQVAKAKQRDLTFQLEEQALRNKARNQRKWMPTACEEALHSAAERASLADEFQNMDEESEVVDESKEMEEVDGEEGDAEDAEEDTQGKVDASIEVQSLREELAAAKADAESSKEVASLLQQQSEEAKDAAAKQIQALQEQLAAAKAAEHRQQQAEDAEVAASRLTHCLQEELAAAKVVLAQAEATKADSSREVLQTAKAAKDVQATAARDIRAAAAELSELRMHVEAVQASQKQEAEAQRNQLVELKELEAAKQKDIEKQLQSAKDRAEIVMAENATLRREVNALREASPALQHRQEPEETFWDRVMASIACARTTAKPTSPSSNGRAQSGEAHPEPIRLSMPVADGH
ncbi:unnamed protein product [Symbiodinium sp. CCMP2456]|nr:unnamed protein product [Symbiodinium sp. CCMP2456]